MTIQITSLYLKFYRSFMDVYKVLLFLYGKYLAMELDWDGNRQTAQVSCSLVTFSNLLQYHNEPFQVVIKPGTESNFDFLILEALNEASSYYIYHPVYWIIVICS